MTKFDDLCAAYAQSRSNYFSYREDCFECARKLAAAFNVYLQIPKDQVEYVPTNEEPKPNTKYSLVGAMHLDDDTYWHLGIRITLYEKPKTYPHQPVLLKFHIKKQDGKYLVKVRPDDKPTEVDPSKPDGFNAIFDLVFSMIKDNFESGLQRFLDDSASVRRIGFV